MNGLNSSMMKKTMSIPLQGIKSNGIGKCPSHGRKVAMILNGMPNVTLRGRRKMKQNQALTMKAKVIGITGYLMYKLNGKKIPRKGLSRGSRVKAIAQKGLSSWKRSRTMWKSHLVTRQ